MLSVATSEGSTDRKQCISQSSPSNIITKGLEKNNPVHLPCDLIGHQIRVTPWGTLHKNSFFFSIFGTALKISFSFRWSQNAYLKYAIRKYDISLSKKVKLFPLLIFTLFWMDQTKCIFPYRKGFFFPLLIITLFWLNKGLLSLICFPGGNLFWWGKISISYLQTTEGNLRDDLKLAADSISLSGIAAGTMCNFG